MFSSKVLILALTLGANLFLHTLSDDPEKLCKDGALKYQVGKSYIYGYSSKWTPKDAALEVTGQVVLTPLKNCEFILTLEDSIMKSGADKNFKENGKISKSSLRFRMYDIDSNILEKEVEEDILAGNVNRGILSMIQNIAFISKDEGVVFKELEESVFGTCMTNSAMSSKNVYKREIDLTECDGEYSHMIEQGMLYRRPGVVNKNIIPQRKSLSCEQTLKDGIISEVRCTQNIYTPFGMANVDLESSLVYKSTTDRKVTDDETEKFDRASSREYNFAKTFSPEMEKNAIEKVKSLLGSLNKVNVNKAEVFMDLKRVMSKISNLKQFNDPSILPEEINAKIFYDAAAEISTDGAVELLSELASKGVLDTTTLINFYTNMAFASNPGRKAMNALKDLVSHIRVEKSNNQDSELKQEFEKNVSLSQLLLLGSSGLAHQFCQTNQFCGDVPEYNLLVNAIAQYAKADTQEDILRGALFALGNLDHLTTEAASAVNAILIRDNSTPDWLRILALEAFRRDGNNSELCKTAANLLADKLKTDDVRIQAYIALTGCASTYQEGLDEPFNKILQDQSSQVGPFIVSHVRGLRDSVSPSEEEYKLAVERNFGKLISEEFAPPTHHRASRYKEYSYFSEEENYGYSGEAKIIFVKGNLHPQFVALKATVDLYGTSFNFLEIGLSQRMIMTTKMFHPDSAPANWWSLMEAFSAHDSYYRVFGTTIGVGLSKLHEAVQMSIRKGQNTGVTIMDEIIPKTFLDEEFIYPTIIGLPLTYNLQAMQLDSIKFEMIGNLMDFKIFDAAEFDLKLKIMADSAAAFKGFVSIGANTPIHIGTQAEGMVDHKQNIEFEAIKKDNGKQLEFRVNFPDKVISWKSIKADIFKFEDLNGIVTKCNKSKRVARDDSNVMYPVVGRIQSDFESNLLGLRAYHGSIENEMGEILPFEFYTAVEKTDEKMTGYSFQFNKNKKPKESYELIITTPGSDIQRNFTVKVEYDHKRTGDKTEWVSTDVEIQGKVDNDKYFTHTKIITKPVFGSCWYGDYSIITEYSAQGNADLTKLIEIELSQNGTEENLKCEAKARFGGPLKFILGEIDYTRTRRREEKENGNLFDHSETIELEVNDAVYWNDLLADSKEKRRFSFVQRLNGYSRLSKKNCPKGETYGCAIAKPLIDEVSYIAKFSEGNDVKYEIDSSFNTNMESVYKTNLSATFKEANEKSKRFQFTIETLKDIHKYRKILAASPKFDLSLYVGDQCIADTMLGISDNSISVRTSIPQFVVLSGNATNDKGQHTHISIEYVPEQMTLTADVDINDDGKEFKEKTKVTLDEKRRDKMYTYESQTVLNRQQRTLTVASKSADKKKLLSKFDLSVKLAQDLFNGKSTALMSIADGSGELYKGSMNETIANKNSILNSQFALQIEDVKSEFKKPLDFTWDLVVNGQLKSPDLYDMQTHISSDKKITAKNLDIEIIKEISWTKTKGKDAYHFEKSTNMTSDKKIVVQSEVTADIDNPTPENGKLTVSGFAKDSAFKNDFSGVILHSGKPTTGFIDNITFSVDRTNLESGTVEKMMDGSINDTSIYKSLEDFELNEVGRVTLTSDKTYNWGYLVKYHNGQFIIQ